MIVVFFAYYLLMRTLPEAIDSDGLYWVMDSLLMLGISIYIFKKSQKTIINLFFTIACVVVFSYDLIDYSQMVLFGNESSDNWIWFISLSIGGLLHLLLFRNRYKWHKLKSIEYNPSKVQAVYSKPNDLITLLGATTSLSPKCSVRYTYNGKMIRFKRGHPTPIMTGAVIKKTDIIENTNIDPDYFYQRFDEIKKKNYNIITFNCNDLFKVNSVNLKSS